MDRRDIEQWNDLIDRYMIVKQLVIEIEEVDQEKNTRIQAYNELKATLDHCMRWMGVELGTGQGVETLPEDAKNTRKETEYRSAKSHLKRAFFDTADLLTLVYRNKIIEFLEPFSSDDILKCLPSYYAEDKAEIEKIEQHLSWYRFAKGTEKNDDFEESFEPYTEDLEKLREINLRYHAQLGTLMELKSERDDKELSDHKKNQRNLWIGITGAIIGIVGIIVGAIVGIFF